LENKILKNWKGENWLTASAFFSGGKNRVNYNFGREKRRYLTRKTGKSLGTWEIYQLHLKIKWAKLEILEKSP
jgi:hypothetical protein